MNCGTPLTDTVQVKEGGLEKATDEKLEVLAARVRAGLPLWHGGDRRDFDEDDR